MSPILEQVEPLVQQYGGPGDRARFLVNLLWRNVVRDRFEVTEETLGHARAFVAVGQETGSPLLVVWAGYYVGWCHLHRGELDPARQELEASLALAEQAGHTLAQALCLRALNVLIRRRGSTEEVRLHPRQCLDRRFPVSSRLYIATSMANLAWLAWREGDLAEAERRARAALGIWQATSWVSYYWWMALWPLIAVMLTRDRVSEAVAHARRLLDESQERMPEAVERRVEEAIAAWDGGEAELAQERLEQAVELAEEGGYL